MSLRSRLILLSSMLVLVGMLFGMAFQVTQARKRVSDELAAASELAFQLVDTMLGSVDEVNTSERALLLNRLQAMEAVRHLDIRLVADDAAVPPVVPGVTDALAPAWFAKLVQVPAVVRQRRLDANDSVLIRSNAAAEIGEVWQESRDFLAVLGLVLDYTDHGADQIDTTTATVPPTLNYTIVQGLEGCLVVGCVPIVQRAFGFVL